MLEAIKKIFSPDDDYDYDEYDYLDEEEYDAQASIREQSENKRTQNTAIQFNKHNKTNTPDFVFVKPTQYKEVFAIADAVKERQIVTVNLESTNDQISCRILDFLSGVAYTNNADIRKVSKNIISIIPCICEYRELTDTEEK